MGILEKLIHRNNANDNTNTFLNFDKKSLCADNIMTVHPDLQNLLWFADGPQKNYIPSNKEKFYSYNGIHIAFSSFSQQEPSLISVNMPVQLDVNPEQVERPPYFPTYANLSPAQRGLYWNFLSNPYSGHFDIGYVFILYYGLERHLLEGNYIDAINVILKLRDVYDNSSFQSYSACAIILTCLIRQDGKMASLFYNSLDKAFEFNFSHNLYLLCKFGLSQPLTAQDIMRMSKTFEFSNQNYIKKYPEIFSEELLQIMNKTFGCNFLEIDKYITSTSYKRLPFQETPIFANTSILDKTIRIPLLTDCFKLKKTIYDLLEQTHANVKVKLSQMRKEGTIPKEKLPKKPIIIDTVNFDFNAEKALLEEYKKNSDNVFKRHFILIQLQDFYYKYRNLDDKYLNLCILYCNEDISSLTILQNKYIEDERKALEQRKDIYSKSEFIEEYKKIGAFVGDIPAFKRLAIIYEKQKRFEDAIDVCIQAINYYNGISLQTSANDFQNRIIKLKEKALKLHNNIKKI